MSAGRHVRGEKRSQVPRAAVPELGAASPQRAKSAKVVGLDGHHVPGATGRAGVEGIGGLHTIGRFLISAATVVIALQCTTGGRAVRLLGRRRSTSRYASDWQQPWEISGGQRELCERDADRR